MGVPVNHAETVLALAKLKYLRKCLRVVGGSVERMIRLQPGGARKNLACAKKQLSLIVDTLDSETVHTYDGFNWMDLPNG